MRESRHQEIMGWKSIVDADDSETTKATRKQTETFEQTNLETLSDEEAEDKLAGILNSMGY